MARFVCASYTSFLSSQRQTYRIQTETIQVNENNWERIKCPYAIIRLFNLDGCIHAISAKKKLRHIIISSLVTDASIKVNEAIFHTFHCSIGIMPLILLIIYRLNVVFWGPMHEPRQRL